MSLYFARYHFARREFQAARQLLDQLLSDVPDAVGPRVLLSHVLLQEGKDAPAAERVLREILDLDPTNVEAMHNLSVLLSQLGRT